MYEKYTRANCPIQHCSTHSKNHHISLIIKSKATQVKTAWWETATDDTNRFFHILSVDFATASSLQTLYIHHNHHLFFFISQSFHLSTLLNINLSIHDLYNGWIHI